MNTYVQRFQTIENSYANIVSAWKAGNRALIDSMGEDYKYLDNESIGTAMVIDDNALKAIKSSLTKSFGHIDGRTLTPMAKSIASGTYFKELGVPLPKSVIPSSENGITEVKRDSKNESAIDAEKHAKARQIGRGNPIFQKLMPGNLNGKFMGKTGKFSVEYQTGDDIANILNSKVRDIADYADEILGNDEYEGNDQRIFVSKELELEDDRSVCVVMYHGIDGNQNKEIASAVKESICDIVPSGSDLRISNTYSVLNTELRNAESNYANAGFNISEYAPSSSHVNMLRRNEALNHDLLPREQEYDTQMSL